MIMTVSGIQGHTELLDPIEADGEVVSHEQKQRQRQQQQQQVDGRNNSNGCNGDRHTDANGDEGVVVDDVFGIDAGDNDNDKRSVRIDELSELCEICLSHNHEDEDNYLLWCDGCDMLVHVLCYGDPRRDQGDRKAKDWYCLRCKYFPRCNRQGINSAAEEKEGSCHLCEKTRSAMRFADAENGKSSYWVHVNCARLLHLPLAEQPAGAGVGGGVGGGGGGSNGPASAPKPPYTFHNFNSNNCAASKYPCQICEGEGNVAASRKGYTYKCNGCGPNGGIGKCLARAHPSCILRVVAGIGAGDGGGGGEGGGGDGRAGVAARGKEEQGEGESNDKKEGKLDGGGGGGGRGRRDKEATQRGLGSERAEREDEKQVSGDNLDDGDDDDDDDDYGDDDHDEEKEEEAEGKANGNGGVVMLSSVGREEKGGGAKQDTTAEEEPDDKEEKEAVAARRAAAAAAAGGGGGGEARGNKNQWQYCHDSDGNLTFACCFEHIHHLSQCGCATPHDCESAVSYPPARDTEPPENYMPVEERARTQLKQCFDAGGFAVIDADEDSDDEEEEDMKGEGKGSSFKMTQLVEVLKNAAELIAAGNGLRWKCVLIPLMQVLHVVVQASDEDEGGARGALRQDWRRLRRWGKRTRGGSLSSLLKEQTVANALGYFEFCMAHWLWTTRLQQVPKNSEEDVRCCAHMLHLLRTVTRRLLRRYREVDRGSLEKRNHKQLPNGHGNTSHCNGGSSSYATRGSSNGDGGGGDGGGGGEAEESGSTEENDVKDPFKLCMGCMKPWDSIAGRDEPGGFSSSDGKGGAKRVKLREGGEAVYSSLFSNSISAVSPPSCISCGWRFCTACWKVDKALEVELGVFRRAAAGSRVLGGSAGGGDDDADDDDHDDGGGARSSSYCGDGDSSGDRGDSINGTGDCNGHDRGSGGGGGSGSNGNHGAAGIIDKTAGKKGKGKRRRKQDNAASYGGYCTRRDPDECVLCWQSRALLVAARDGDLGEARLILVASVFASPTWQPLYAVPPSLLSGAPYRQAPPPALRPPPKLLRTSSTSSTSSFSSSSSSSSAVSFTPHFLMDTRNGLGSYSNGGGGGGGGGGSGASRRLPAFGYNGGCAGDSGGGDSGGGGRKKRRRSMLNSTAVGDDGDRGVGEEKEKEEEDGRMVALHMAGRRNDVDMLSMLLHFVRKCVAKGLVSSLPAIFLPKDSANRTPVDICHHNPKNRDNSMEAFILLSSTFDGLPCIKRFATFPKPLNLPSTLAATKDMKHVKLGRPKLGGPDISCGREITAIPWVNNTTDGEIFPAHTFTYITRAVESCGEGKVADGTEIPAASVIVDWKLSLGSKPPNGCSCSGNGSGQSKCGNSHQPKETCNFNCSCAFARVQAHRGGKGDCINIHDDWECNNRPLDTGVTRKLQVFKTEKMGWGVRAMEPLPRGVFLCEYAGEMVYGVDTDRREDWYRRVNDGRQYVFQLRKPTMKEIVIDATMFRNVAAFFNHKCSDFNVKSYSLKGNSNSKPTQRLGYFTKREIQEGEQLFISYGAGKPTECKCGCQPGEEDEGSVYRRRGHDDEDDDDHSNDGNDDDDDDDE